MNFRRLIWLAPPVALLAAVAYAHNAICDCFDNGDNTITCEGGFSDGGKAVGVPVRVRHGHVWWLAAESGEPSRALDEAGGAARGGLLANPHSQEARVLGDSLPVPAIEPGEGEEEP